MRALCERLTRPYAQAMAISCRWAEWLAMTRSRSRRQQVGLTRVDDQNHFSLKKLANRRIFKISGQGWDG
jgi:hypothetical protein